MKAKKSICGFCFCDVPEHTTRGDRVACENPDCEDIFRPSCGEDRKDFTRNIIEVYVDEAAKKTPDLLKRHVR